MQHYIKTVHFWLNVMALLLCKRQQNCWRVVTVVFWTIGIYRYVITSTFFLHFFTFFSKSKSRDFLRFFAVFRTFSQSMPIAKFVCLSVCWLARLLSFKRPLLSVDVSIDNWSVGNSDAKYLGN